VKLPSKSIPERHEMIVKRVVPRIAVAIAIGALAASVPAYASAVGDRPDTLPAAASSAMSPASPFYCCPICWCWLR
jgi:hypothetical protein